MKVAMVSGLGRVWDDYPPDVLDRDTGKTVGGGEAAMLSLAFGLQAHGYQVSVFYPGAPGVYRGVTFRAVAAAPIEVALGDFDCVISWSDPRILKLAPKGTLRIFSQQLNDVPWEENFWKNLDGFFCPAETHMKHLLKYTPSELTAHIRFATIPNGVNLALFSSPTPFAERAHSVGYWSSPDRGLHHLFRIWPGVRRRVPDAELHVFYHLTKWVESGKDSYSFPDFCWRARVVAECLKRPIDGLVIHGPVNRWELAKWQKKTKVMAYPLDPLVFTEGFSIACLENYAAGGWTIAHPDDAIEEVHGDAVDWVRGAITDPDYLQRFTDRVVAALLADENPFERVGYERARGYAWENAVTKLDSFLGEM